MPTAATTLVESILTQSNEVEATGENEFLLKEIFRFIPNIKKFITIDEIDFSGNIHEEQLVLYPCSSMPQLSYLKESHRRA